MAKRKKGTIVYVDNDSVTRPVIRDGLRSAGRPVKSFPCTSRINGEINECRFLIINVPFGGEAKISKYILEQKLTSSRISIGLIYRYAKRSELDKWLKGANGVRIFEAAAGIDLVALLRFCRQPN